jgi:hypothetical protein
VHLVGTYTVEYYYDRRTHEQNQSNPIQLNISTHRKGRYFSQHLNTIQSFQQATEEELQREVNFSGI